MDLLNYCGARALKRKNFPFNSIEFVFFHFQKYNQHIPTDLPTRRLLYLHRVYCGEYQSNQRSANRLRHRSSTVHVDRADSLDFSQLRKWLLLLSCRIHALLYRCPSFIFQIRNLKYLAPFCTLANIVTILSFGIILYYIFRDPPSLENRHAMGPIREFPLFIGTVLFALEAIGVVSIRQMALIFCLTSGGAEFNKRLKLPISAWSRLSELFLLADSSIRKRNENSKIIWNEIRCAQHSYDAHHLPVRWNGPLWLPELWWGCERIHYIEFASRRMVRSESIVRGWKCSNQQFYSRLAQSVKGMLAFGIFITHALACYVAIDITWTDYVVKRVANSGSKTLWEYAVRTGLVLITCKCLLCPTSSTRD